MNKLRLTQHAMVRMRQRAIPPAVVDALMVYGREEHDHHGGTIVYFDKAARRRLVRERMDRALERYLDAYAVIAKDGAVLTVGHRDKRIWRH